MPRNIHIFVGDRVKTVHGEGVVEDVTTWRDRIGGMSDPEARDFCDQCFRSVGVDYKEKWAEIAVAIGGRMRKYLPDQVTVLEGRDGSTG